MSPVVVADHDRARGGIVTVEFQEAELDRGGRRRRIAAGVGAAMLVAGAAGVGFGIGQSVGESDDAADVVAPAADADAFPPPTSAEVVDSDTSGTAESPAVADDADPAPDLDVEPDAAVDEVPPVASGGAGWSTWIGPAYELLYERTTDAGHVLRASRGETWDPTVGWGAGWQPEPWCYPTADLRVTISGPGIVDVGGAGWYSAPIDGQSITWLTMGRADGQPQRVVVVQATTAVQEVEVRFDDGAIDRTPIVNGLAVLAAPGEFNDDGYHVGDVATPPDGGFEVSYIGAAGATVVDSSEVMHASSAGYEDACVAPPPGLPDPGEQQPAEPEAAEAAIVAAMEALYDTSRDVGTELGLLDDATGVEDAVTQMQTGPSASLAEGVSAEIDELVFTTPTEAWFRYDLVDAGGGRLLVDRYGIAVEIEGSWKITRATICQDLQVAGGDCGSSEVPAYQPVGSVPR